jgi:CDP-diacylglycerol--glycerol-3-phosphate 3-phosphatidyltransferase
MSAPTAAEGEPPAALRRRFRLTVLAVLAASVAAALGVAAGLGEGAGARWLVAATPAVGALLWLLRRALPRNHPPDRAAAVRSTLGPATAVTLGRGWLVTCVAGFLLVVPAPGSPWRWAPFLLYGGGAALDAVDGWLARTVGARTELGARLDMAFDTLGFLVAPLVGVVWGRIPVWYLSISVARYLFRAGRGWRRARGKPVFDLPPSRVRRPLAALQMAFIAWALAPVVPVGVVRPVAAVVVAPSLVVFVRDYLVVAGRLGGGDGG